MTQTSKTTFRYLSTLVTLCLTSDLMGSHKNVQMTINAHTYKPRFNESVQKLSEMKCTQTKVAVMDLWQ